VIVAWLRGHRYATGALFCALLFIAGSLAFAEIQRYPEAPTRIVVESVPIAAFDHRMPSRTRFGALEFRGGLVLSSKAPAFGGISGLYVEPDGARFLAVTDKGSWLRGRIVYRDGRPAGIDDAEMAPLLGSDGRPLAARRWYDIEALAERDGTVYVGIERVEQIVRFDYRRDGLTARGEPIAVPPDFKSFTRNKSLECLAAPKTGLPLAGGLITITEHSLDARGNHRSFIIKGKEFDRFSVKRSDDFDVSDCAILAPADLLLLERRYSPARGVAMRIRRIALADIKPGALVDGKPLIEADLGYEIDNMEGIAVHRNANGETILTLVSDDNFSVIQRTLLLQFALVGE
jgi:hypothetical protein